MQLPTYMHVYMCTSTYSWKNHNPFALDAPANYLCTLIYSSGAHAQVGISRPSSTHKSNIITAPAFPSVSRILRDG